MRGYKIIIVLLALFLVIGASCDMGSLGIGKKKSIQDDDFKGYKGLALNFIESLPPEEVWRGINFGIRLEVQNQGVNDIDKGYICIGSLSSEIFTKADSCQVLNKILGRRNFPGGEIQSYGEGVWDGFNVKETYKVNVDTAYPITAKACYQSSTYASPSVCVRDLNMDKNEAICDAGEVKLESGGQGAPVEVTYLKEDIIPRSGKSELLFTIGIKNSGDGEIIKSDKINDKCIFERTDKDLVNIEVELPGFGKAKCRNEGKIVLINNEGQTLCSGIAVPKGESFSLPLNIKLTYGYLSRIRGEFKIKKDITGGV